ncbi:MAG TPA: GNAT family N-acetyltransferase [Humibacillus xanthopallidus]|nr:GNAT family N-acetyltransferase [Humibacillus xanthopallidus]
MSSMLPEEGEYLTTGWEDDLDPGDSVERQAVLAHVSWARALTSAARGDFTEGPHWCAGSGGGASALLNLAIVTSPPRDWATTVEGLSAAYPTGVSAIVISPFPTPDLSIFGLALVGHPPLMFRPTSTVTATPTTPLEVHEATTVQHLRDAERVLVEGYPMPDMADLPPGDFYRPDVVVGPTRVFVGYDEGVPVATAAAHSAAGVTVVENVAVLATARGKGAGAALTWAATTAWPEQGAVLIASDDGQPVYERLGYLRIVRWTCWLRP